MIARLFGIALALFSVFAGIDELQKLRVLLLPTTEFVRVEGETVGVTSMIDRNPGHAGLAGTNTRVFAVEFKYAIGNAIRTANTMSPYCTFCEGARVVRITGNSPSALEEGTKVTVYVAQSKPGMAAAAGYPGPGLVCVAVACRGAGFFHCSDLEIWAINEGRQFACLIQSVAPQL